MNAIAGKPRYTSAHLSVGQLGVDIGSLYVKLVWIDPSGGWHVGSREHQGRPVAVLRSLLEESGVPAELPIGVTGPLSSIVTDQGVGLGVDPIRAAIRGVREHGPRVRNILDVGGGSLARITMDEDGQLQEYTSNSLCAAGTGSFLDEQARRLGLTLEDIERFGGVADPPTIATRCAVFAKSDLIHRQQEGYGPEANWSGLCCGLVGTILQTLGGGRPLTGPTVMIGGVSRNPEVQRWLHERLGDDFRQADDAHLLPSAGAALVARGEGAEPADWTTLENYVPEAKESHRRPPLKLVRSTYPSMAVLEEYVDEHGTEVRRHVAFPGGTRRVAMGIDIGSTSTKALVMSPDGEVLVDLYCRTSGDPIGATQRLFKTLQAFGDKYNTVFQVVAAATTGSGRKMVGQVIGADLAVNEISAHVSGARAVDPDVETIFEIGGQDAKFMDVRGGFLRDVNMNYVCAAGTGSFVEEQAIKLGFPIAGVGAAVEGIAPPVTSDRCTVFMEQDVHRLLRQGYMRDEVMAAVLYSVVQNYLNRVVGNRRRSSTRISFQGATARNRGLVAAFENLLGVEVVVSPLCHQMGAYGSALLAVREMESRGWPDSGFRGLDLARRSVSLERETCKLCNNYCTITTAQIEGDLEQPSWGYLCGRDPEEHRMKRPDGIRPLEARHKAWMRSRGPKPPAGAPLVGLPRALGTFDQAPMWRTLLEALGCRVKLSSKTNAEISATGIRMSGSDYCYPMKLAHGHAVELLCDDRVDFVFQPFVIGESYDPEETTSAHLCPLNIAQTAAVKAACSGCGITTEHFLAPAVDLQWPDAQVTRELYQHLGTALGVSRDQVAWAWQQAKQALVEFRAECIEIGQQALADLRESGDHAIVLLGRGYNLYDEGANVALPRKMAESGWMVLPQDLLPLDHDTLGPGFKNMFWWSGRRILEAARFVRDEPKMHAVCFTNFSCGPDSFVLTYLEQVMGEDPYLVLELDEHGSDGGYLTRIEAFTDVLDEERPELVKPPQVAPPSGPMDQLGDRTLWLPPMHIFGGRMMAAGFRSAGYNARALPPETEAAFQRGKELCRGTECLPAPATLGALLQALEDSGETPDRHALFMPTAAGPCRFGQYNLLQRLALNRVGAEDLFIVSPGSHDTYNGVGTDLQFKLWRAIVLSDVLLKLRCRVRPYEREAGRVDDIIEDACGDLEQALEHSRDVLPIVRRAARRLERVPVTGEERPLVGIVGEIYVRSNTFCNQDVIGAIERSGGEAWLAPVSEWVLYTAAMQIRNAGDARQPWGWIVAQLKNRTMERDEHRIYQAAGSLLNHRDEPPMGEVLETGEDYIPVAFEGETILTIGRARRFIEDGAAMVVNCAPFTCMPGALTSGVLRQVQEELGAPIVSLFYDGTGDVNRRVELTLSNLRSGGVASRDDAPGAARGPEDGVELPGSPSPHPAASVHAKGRAPRPRPRN